MPCPAGDRASSRGKLVSRLGRVVGGRLRIRLWDADVSADGVLARFVDDNLFGNVRARGVEEDGLVQGAILLFEALVFDGHGKAELVALFVDALQFDGDVANLLGLVLACDGELDIVAFAET